MVDHPLVDALVAAAGEDQVRPGGELAGDGLGEGSPGGRRHDQRSCRSPASSVERLTPRLGLHHHAGAAAVRRVVDGPVPVVGPLPQVVHAHVEEPSIAGLAGQRQRQRVEVRREDRHDVDPHVTPARLVVGVRRHQAGPVGDHDPAAVDVDLGDERGHERHQRVAPVGGADLEQVLGRAVRDGRELAEMRSGDVVRRQADQLVVVELLGVLRRLLRRQGGVQDDPPGGLGGVAVTELREARQEDLLVPPGALDGHRSQRGGGARRRPGRQDGYRRRSAARARRCGRRWSPRPGGRAACRCGRRRPRCPPWAQPRSEAPRALSRRSPPGRRSPRTRRRRGTPGEERRRTSWSRRRP